MKIQEGVPLKHHSTFKLGGNAEYFVIANDKYDLREAVMWAKAAGLPYMVIGEGSNILFSDHGFDGLIIRNNIKGYEFYQKNGSIYVGVGAGENWDDFVADMVRRGLRGIENLSGIPGSVGATPIQNVGAYGREVCDVIAWVEALNTETLETELFTNKQCRFGYRDSFFKTEEGKKFIVTEVGFRLEETGEPFLEYKDLKNYFGANEIKPSLENIRNAVIEIRSKKFPDLNKVGCGGSFFKNPIVDASVVSELKEKYGDVPHYELENGDFKVPLAWILEHATGWKGVRRDTVGVHEDQPIVLVHYGNGSARELKKLSDDIMHHVGRETKIFVTPEVSIVGKF